MQNSYADLFSAFGGVGFLDRIESAGFNRLPAPYLNGSMWSMQYFHKTNAIGGCNAYGLPFECCVANGNQGWPRFTSKGCFSQCFSKNSSALQPTSASSESGIFPFLL